jgi:hypothetical protein
MSNLTSITMDLERPGIHESPRTSGRLISNMLGGGGGGFSVTGNSLKGKALSPTWLTTYLHFSITRHRPRTDHHFTTSSCIHPSIIFTIAINSITMSANTKYSAAPQRDSLDDTARYSQAPPSYVDEPTSSTDQAALLGGPRSSEDNIPDDFKAC